MSDSSARGRLQGRALAQQRRREQALRKQHGRPEGARPSAAPKVQPTVAVTPVVPSGPANADLRVEPQLQAAKPGGRERAQQHRAQRCAGALCWSDPEQRRRHRGQRAAANPVPRAADTVGDGAADSVRETVPPLVPGVEENFLDAVCEMGEAQPDSFGWRQNSVRKLCKARRQSLAQRGKVALTVMRGLSSAAARLRYLETGNAHEFARLHRQELAQKGRGALPPAKPTGQQRSRKYRVPAKVETGTTLAGSEVTGTQVERIPAVTGNEPGSCRVITGTEYVGSEQYSRFCATQPSANPAKVGIGRTSRGLGVSGTQVGRAVAVTGDEAGSCKTVTGTEYLSLESFQSFCRSDLPPRPEKVVIGHSQQRRLPVTGSDEARVNRVTGSEPGANARITGSQYAETGVARMTINGKAAPRKVSETHTVRGEAVTGTAVDSSPKITGLEPGTCRVVTGTEYLSTETFQTLCRTRPEPTEPPKVEVSSTQHGQRITGNLVDRSEKVTGNEPGSCARVTGTGYSNPQLCGGGTDKVHAMTSLSGSVMTGTGMDRLPKTTGDERGGCWPVTGTEYYGREHYAQCASTPQPEAPKTVLSRTGKGQWVTGPAMGPDDAVTGNEAGAHSVVSGTPYGGEELQVLTRQEVVNPMQSQAPESGSEHPGASGCTGCSCQERMRDLEARLAALQEQLAASRTGAGSEPALVAPASRRFVPAPAAPVVASAPEVGASDFSIVTPARQGRSRITGNTGTGGKVTGPVNLGRGLITGTPEFRSGTELARAPQPLPVPQEDVSAPAAGSWRVTGDDWSRNERVTGTEGPWARGRNLTQRGPLRSCVMAAAINKGQELAAPVPDSRITGSSGNSRKGSTVTYSGGARG
ncbi:MAG: CsoS2 family carboxysome shell protein [Acidithiobacillus caldus]|uniref:CsoS2 family carboxysome shell protein n=3 Tax=Acidithiobacillus caldus TaxID=33059 RepID=UPI001D033F1F|nr:CsoS2 family carboxysome shell protein [Acidithiobacillus caldus]WMT46939.1 MAG: CsoS2 family carboxysome shell protein [Acidithiobacillus caldus]